MSKLITKVEGYRAPDGTVFPTQTEAIRHHFRQRLNAFCQQTDNLYFGDDLPPPLTDEQIEALWQNRFELSRIILDLE